MEHVTEGAWESLQVPLHPLVLGALRELGFLHMTPVQVSVPRGSEAEWSVAPVQPRESGRDPSRLFYGFRTPDLAVRGGFTISPPGSQLFIPSLDETSDSGSVCIPFL